MSDLFNKINVLLRASLNDATSNLLNNSANNTNNNQPPPAEGSEEAAKPPSDAERAAARTDEKLNMAISMLQQHFLKITTEMADLDKQIDAALIDGSDEVARQLTHRLQQQQQQAQQIADEMARYNVPLPVPPEPAAASPVTPMNPSVNIPVSTPSSGIRVPVRTGDPVNKPAAVPNNPSPRPASELLSDRPTAPDSDAKLAERRRRLSAPDDNDPKKTG